MIALVLRSAFLALLVTSTTSLTMAAPASSSSELSRWQPVRFSDLTDLTPANVRGLLPLVSRGVDGQLDAEGVPLQQRSSAHGSQVNSMAGVDPRLRRFLDARAHLQLAMEQPPRPQPHAGVAGCDISYVIGTPATAEPAATVPKERELRAWDTIERHAPRGACCVHG